MHKKEEVQFINREKSWLSFNERVLQEAIDKRTPLIERLRFLGIFSSNRDEFFRVRVATVRRMTELGKKTREQLYDSPEELIAQINEITLKQGRKFDSAYISILKELNEYNIHIPNENQLDDTQRKIALSYFKETIRPNLVPIMLTNRMYPDLTDKASYLAVKLYNQANKVDVKYALIEIPSQNISRFYILPEKDGHKYIMILDDIIRLGLAQVFRIFDFDTIESYAFKLTRDAELDIDDDLDESLMEKLEKSINKRKSGKPVRFVYDKTMPTDLLDFLIDRLNLKNQQNLIPSGRYNNQKDLINFPNVGSKTLVYKRQTPNRHRDLHNQRSLLEVILKKDVLLHYPYQAFSHTIDILREAAIDPSVTAISINLYRIAQNSKIINALINASKNGKDVTVIVELRARFDEEYNIECSRRLQENGVKVISGVEGLKVHAKLVLITRKVGLKKVDIAHIGTGNFHEGNTRIYTDHSLWTADTRITHEVAKLFEFFRHNFKPGIYRELIVSPFNTRRRITELIDVEIKNAKEGKPAYMVIKLNNLVDEELVRKLYKASQAGVKIQMLIRGICSLMAGIPGLSENIEIRSVLDRYLEHSRVMIFANGGNERIFIGSADWMGRNLDMRIEVITPIYDTEIKKNIRKIINIQLNDNTKARTIDADLKNEYWMSDGPQVQSQVAIYAHYKRHIKE